MRAANPCADTGSAFRKSIAKPKQNIGEGEQPKTRNLAQIGSQVVTFLIETGDD